MRGDAYTKELRLAIKETKKMYFYNKRRDKEECDRGGGCSDWYDAARSAASQVNALMYCLETYLRFKGWKK